MAETDKKKNMAETDKKLGEYGWNESKNGETKPKWK